MEFYKSLSRMPDNLDAVHVVFTYKEIVVIVKLKKKRMRYFHATSRALPYIAIPEFGEEKIYQVESMMLFILNPAEVCRYNIIHNLCYTDKQVINIPFSE